MGPSAKGRQNKGIKIQEKDREQAKLQEVKGAKHNHTQESNQSNKDHLAQK